MLDAHIGLEQSQTVQVAHAKLVAEEQANLEAKENARLEMERIGREADIARQKTIAQQHLAEVKKGKPDKDLPGCYQHTVVVCAGFIQSYHITLLFNKLYLYIYLTSYRLAGGSYTAVGRKVYLQAKRGCNSCNICVNVNAVQVRLC